MKIKEVCSENGIQHYFCCGQFFEPRKILTNIAYGDSVYYSAFENVKSTEIYQIQNELLMKNVKRR